MLFFTVAKSQTNKQTAADIKVYTHFKDLEPLLYTDSETVHIVNFWAMWCGPCVKEFPIFKAYQEKNPSSKIILISMDFPEDIETKLKPFLQKKGITSKVVMLDDPDANTWINKVDANWSGAIPFTIIFNNKNRSYYERDFKSVEDLENEINKTIKND